MIKRHEIILAMLTHPKVTRKRSGGKVSYSVDTMRIDVPLPLAKKIDKGIKGRKYMHDLIVMYDNLFQTNFNV